MFLLPSLLVGVVCALVLGGKPSRLADVRLRGGPLVFVSLAVQVMLFSRTGASLAPWLHDTLHIATYALLGIFAAVNMRVRALLPVVAGLTSNAIAIVANGGHMPVSRSAAAAAHLTAGAASNVTLHSHRLGFLGDVFALPSQLPFANVFSIGDILIGAGVIGFVVVAATHEQGERTLDLRRLVTPLRNDDYRRLVSGRLVSQFGDWLTLAALVGWVYAHTGSTANAAAVLLARLAPPILGGSVASLVVDRLSKQRVLVWIEVVRGATVCGALVGVSTGAWQIVLAALALSGALAAISNASVPAFLPALLPQESLQSANAGLGIAKDVAMAAGSLVAGIALATTGVGAALLVDLATFAVAVALFARLPHVRRSAPSTDGERVTSGLRYVLRHRWIVLLVGSFAAATLATGLTNATLPRFLGSELGLGAGGYGFGLAALAGGLALGEIAVGLTRMGATAGRWIGAGLLLNALLFALLGLEHHAPTALLLLGAIGFVDGTTDVLFETVIQRDGDPRYYGAIFGFASALMTTTMMGAIALAPLANGLAAPATVILAATAFLVAAGAIALLAARMPHRRLRVPETVPA